MKVEVIRIWGREEKVFGFLRVAGKCGGFRHRWPHANLAHLSFLGQSVNKGKATLASVLNHC
jgi:hypothetical protein